MTENRSCPRCASPLPADAPEGACPRCLLVAGLESRAGRGGPVSAPSPDELAAYFPALEILELLGQGGMGIVYKARQTALDRLVALKILAPEMAGDAAFSDRFMREARALARLSHPNIVGVHDFGETEGLYYFVMEYVDGANLREAQRERRLEPEQALAIVPQICDALQYAHDNGVVHRDIKPENVLIDRDGHVKIADFGLAKLLSSTPAEFTLTRAGQVMGTPHYMAPEQIETPSDVDHRADIYSLGVVFYEMLTGELPIGRFEPPSRKVQVDVRLDDVVLRALEKAPDRRYQQVSEVKTRVNGLDAPASAPPAAPASVPPPVAAVDGARSRLSRLALCGFLCFPGSILALLLIGVLAYASAGTLRTGVGIMVIVALVPGFMTLAGVVLSISGWIAIARSSGRLHGKAFAALGTFLPLFCVPATLGWLTIRATPVAPAPVASQGGAGYWAVNDYLRFAAESDPHGADLERLLEMTVPEDAAVVRDMSPARRAERARTLELGPLFWLAYTEGETLVVSKARISNDESGWLTAVRPDESELTFRVLLGPDGVWRVRAEPFGP